MSRSPSAVALVSILALLTGCSDGAAPTSSESDGYDDSARAPASVGPATRPDSVAGTKSDMAREPARAPVQLAPRRAPPTSQLQPGILTAGCLDDHAQYEEFSAYLSNAMQDHRVPAFDFAFGRRAVVRVTNELGQPIADARVKVRANDGLVVAAAGQGSPLRNRAAEWEMTTGADGTAAPDSNAFWSDLLQILAIVVIAVLWRGIETFLEV